jgi:hypothetical protein
MMDKMIPNSHGPDHWHVRVTENELRWLYDGWAKYQAASFRPALTGEWMVVVWHQRFNSWEVVSL